MLRNVLVRSTQADSLVSAVWLDGVDCSLSFLLPLSPSSLSLSLLSSPGCCFSLCHVSSPTVIYNLNVCEAYFLCSRTARAVLESRFALSSHHLSSHTSLFNPFPFLPTTNRPQATVPGLHVVHGVPRCARDLLWGQHTRLHYAWGGLNHV